MTRAELDDLARAEYDACQTPKPTWDQLGDTTKDVWREFVVKGTHIQFPPKESNVVL